MNKKSGSLYESTSKDEVVWGKGSSFNVCDSVGGGNWGAERYRTMDNKWKYILTNHSGTGIWYDHYGMGEFDTVEELNLAIINTVARKNGRNY